METTNISKYLMASNPGILDKTAVREAIAATYRTDTNICIRFHGLDGYDFWFNAGEIIDAGGLSDYLTSILDEPTTKAILNCDYEIVDTDDELTYQYFGRYGTFDWSEYGIALDEYNKSWMDLDAFADGINLGIPPDKIQDAYVGKFRCDADYAEEQIGIYWEIPKQLKPYIDWEAVARGYCDSFHSINKHYFLANY